ncbi:MAG: ATP-binding protein [Planctomycetes bacterium]|nr:ATP-binding protein [Planctomycetota bacterium]
MTAGADDFCIPVLREAGFALIGDLRYEQHVQPWWHPGHRMEFLLYLGSPILAKGTKSYFLAALSAAGETFVRDLAAVQDLLETTFVEAHLAFTYFRDVTSALCWRRMMQKRAARRAEQDTADPASQEAELARLARQFDARKNELRRTESFLKLNGGRSQLVGSYLTGRSGELRKELGEIGQEARKVESDVAEARFLLQEYRRKGAAACMIFSFSSNLQVAANATDFQDATNHIVKEVLDLDRFQIRQKLNGGKLQVFVEEVRTPVLSWQIQWAGGRLNPRQLDRLGPAFQDLATCSDEMTMVTPVEDIVTGGAVRDEKKLVGAWVVRNFMKRLGVAPEPGVGRQKPSEGKLPIWVGLAMERHIVTPEPETLALDQAGSIYVSGASGGGKTYLARVIIEGAASYELLNLLVLDPRNQSASVLLPEDREEVLAQYGEFGMKREQARGFDFRYHGAGIQAGQPLPDDLAQLGFGRAIVSFKEMSDRGRCELFACILERVFEEHSREEAESLKTLIVVDEAHLFTRKRVGEDAVAAAERAERTLETVLREGRKYGLRAIVVSQSSKDFSYGAVAIREGTGTKFFLKNSDREVDYAADFIGDGRQIIQLPTGVAICHNAAWGVRKFRVRPPLSKVFELSSEDTRRLLGKMSRGPIHQASADAQRLLGVATDYLRDTGAAINLTEAGEKLGVTSKRKMQDLVEELKRKGLARTTHLNRPGSPRVITPLSRPESD